MAGPSTAPPGRRARHTPVESEREILAAAEQLLRERPFRAITVSDIMARTGLKRPAFYVHFSDRYELVLRVVEQIGAELFEMADRWLKGSAPREDIRDAMDGVTRVYAAHGPVMRALADAAASDARVEHTYRALVQGFVDATAEHIEAEQQAARIARELDAAETARALMCMNERYLYETLGAQAHGDPQQAAAVLLRIWLATLYP